MSRDTVYAQTAAGLRWLMTPALPHGGAGLFLPRRHSTGTRAPRDLPWGEVMESNVWLIASAWMALALLASLLSIRLGTSVALLEAVIGVFAGNVFGIESAPWIDFLAPFGAGLLTFLAGAEIEPTGAPRGRHAPPPHRLPPR